MTPVFVFSLPRAGSTLLQRILMGHTEIHSVSEPWVFLPIAYMLPNNDGEIITPYDHQLAQRAIVDVIECLPRGMEEYYEYNREVLQNFYARLCSNTQKRYFLDKTPRYFLIIPFIRRIFPDAKFIFLFRHPLAVLASIIETWGAGRLGQLYLNHVDLYRGPLLLSEGLHLMQNEAISIQYEDLVAKPRETVTYILDYLALDNSELDLSLLSGDGLKGTLGDQIGTKRYSNVEGARLERWKDTYCTYFRILFARRYLRAIGERAINGMGYDYDVISSELDAIRPHGGVGVIDAIDTARVSAYRVMQSEVVRKMAKKILIPGNLTWKLRKGCKDD